MSFNNFKNWFLVVAALVALSSSNASAFSNPSVNPAGGAGSIYIEASTPANTFYLKSNGNVGIGTTNPAGKLTIIGSSTIGGATFNNGWLQIGTSASGITIDGNEIFQAGDQLYIGTLGTGNVVFRRSGTVDTVTILGSNGYVGIAKVPTTALDVNGTVTATAFAGPLSGSISSANVSAGSFGANTGGGNYTFPANLTVTGTYNGYQPSKSATSTNSVYSLDSRSTNHLPQDRAAGLYPDFRGNTVDGLVDGGTYHGVLTFRSYGNTTDFSGGQAMQFAYTDNSNMWARFGSAATWGSWKKLIISDAAGNVSIGTAVSNSKLTIGADFASTTGITVDTGGTMDSALVMRRAAGKTALGILPYDSQVYFSAGNYYDNGVWIQNNDTPDNLLFVLDPGGGARWYASNDGTASWNVASNKQLWDASGNWVGSLTGTVSAANVSSGNFGTNTGGGNYTFPANVGVGTTSPTSPAGVNRFLQISGPSHAGIVLTDTDAGAGSWDIWNNDGGLYTYRGGIYGWVQSTSGNVGIGTTAPTTKLEVQSAAGGPMASTAIFGGNGANAAITINSAGTSNYAYQTFAQGGTGKWEMGATGDGNGNFYLNPTVQNGYSGAALSILRNSNVGISNTAPAYKLDVTGDIHSTGWVRTDGSYGWYSQTYGGGWFMQDTSWIRTYGAKNIWTSSGLIGSDGGLTIGYGGAGSPSGGAVIAGNVGIGTSAPATKLDVDGNITQSVTHGNNMKLWLSAARNGGGAGEVGLYSWISEPGVTWTGGGIARNMYNTTGFPRVNAALSGQMVHFTEGGNIELTVETAAGSRTTPLTVSPGVATVSGSLTVTGNSNICHLVSYSGGTTACPAGYYTWSGNALASGYMLCCKVDNPI